MSVSPAEPVPAVQGAGWIQRILIIVFLVAGVGATVYGLVHFDWAGKPQWDRQELMQVGIALALPAIIMLGGFFTAFWPRLAVFAVLASTLVTYGPEVIGVLLLCAVGFIAIGHLIFRIALDTVEDGLLCFALGFGTAGAVIGLTAQFRAHFDFVYASVFLGAAFLARKSLLSWCRAQFDRLMKLQDGPLATRAFGNLGASVALLVVIALMLYATVRESGFDGLVTHFYMTEALRLHGEFNFDWSIQRFVLGPKTGVWSLGVFDMIGGEYALRAAHSTLFSITAALLAMRASPLGGRGNAGLLVAGLLSAPVVYWVSSHFFEESSGLLFVTASAIFFMRGDEKKDVSVRQDWAALAALGLAISSKPQALFLGLIGVAIVGRRLFTDRSVRGVLSTLAGVVIFLLIAAPPYLRAFLATGNPFYPFVPGAVNDPRFERSPTLLTPYEMTFKTSTFMESYPGGFAFQFLFLLAAAFAAIVLLRPRTVSSLVVAGLVFAVALSTQTLYARYQLYAFPLFMLGAAALLPEVMQAGRVAFAAISFALVPLNMAFWPAIHVQAFSLSQLLAPQYTSYVPPERKAFEALNDLFGENTSVYVAGSSPFSAGLAGTPHAWSRIALELNKASTIRDVARLLREGKITHVVVADGQARNPVVLEACKVVCKEFPLENLPLRIFQVDLTRAGLLADRDDALQLLVSSSQADMPQEMKPSEGWQHEDWGWWSIAPQAQVQLASGFTGASELVATVQPFAPPGTAGLDVAISLDGVAVDTWHFDPVAVGTRQERKIHLPAPIATGAPGKLTFSFSRTYKPKDTIGGADERTLALGLIDLWR